MLVNTEILNASDSCANFANNMHSFFRMALSG